MLRASAGRTALTPDWCHFPQVGAQLSAAQAQATGLNPAALNGRVPAPRAEGSGEGSGSGDESSGQGSHDADAARPAAQEAPDARAGGLPARPVRAACALPRAAQTRRPRHCWAANLRRPCDISARLTAT